MEIDIWSGGLITDPSQIPRAYCKINVIHSAVMLIYKAMILLSCLYRKYTRKTRMEVYSLAKETHTSKKQHHDMLLLHLET